MILRRIIINRRTPLEFLFTRGLRMRYTRYYSRSGSGDEGGFKFPVWKSLGFTGLCGIGLIYYYKLQITRRELHQRTMEMSGVSGAPRLGGHLQLVDQEGRPFDSATLNKFMLVYFGFTHCPDICPEELDRMTEIIKSVEVEGQKLGVPSDMVVPVFVTIDPTRDGPAQMKEYLKDFHPSFVGLSGSEEQIRAAARKYRVYYRPARTLATSSEGQDYLMDHSIFFFLIDPNGKYLAHFGRDTIPQRAAQFILNAMQSWQSN